MAGKNESPITYDANDFRSLIDIINSGAAAGTMYLYSGRILIS